MNRARTWTPKLAFLAVVLGAAALPPRAASADDRFKFNLVLEGRVATTPVARSFLDGGLGKTRYGSQPRAVEAKLAQAALLGRFEARPDLTLRVQANVDAEHNFKRRLDLVEAVVRYAPALTDALSLDIRAGLFFPTISLENIDPAWLSPYTTSFSAINAWIGEEVRNLGVEAGPSFRIGEVQARLFGAFTRGNDPNGTLLAWRGFALHDRVSGFGDRLPLPDLASFKREDLFPDQPREVQPWREVDQKWTWSAGLAVTHEKYRLKLLYQPKTASPGAFDGQQYAWRTGYWAAGAARSFGPVEVLVQGLGGETRMGVVPGHENAVAARFESLYLLATWLAAADGRHRATVRYDAFRVQDRDDFMIEDANDESGTAWTFAYTFSPNGRHRLTAELLHVDSTRTNRHDLGLAPRAIEILGTLSWRISF
jgi:hypothetical protein